MGDSVFFVFSKLGWALVAPDSLLLLMVATAWACLLAGWQKLARRLLSLCLLLLLAVAFLPLGEWLLAPLENRFETGRALPADVDGIIVLGGAISPQQSRRWGQVELNNSAERMTSFVYLAELYPGAQLLFSGGSGSLLEQEDKEASYARLLLEQLGVSDRAIVYESESRNTFENARNSHALMNPGASETWILVTSAFHMPRAVGVFCAQQWPVIPYPVDHFTRRGNLLRVGYDFAPNLNLLRMALREWAGLVVYRLSGRSARLLAGSNDRCQA